MTGQYVTLTVALENEVQVDDAQQLINAIRMLKGVADVTGHVNNLDVWTAKVQLRRELADKLYEALKAILWGSEEKS